MSGFLFFLLGALVTVSVGYWTIRVTRKHGRQPYELSYEVLEDRQFDWWTKHSIIIEGQEIPRPRYLRIRVENTGRAEFVPEDFDTPVTFSLANAAVEAVTVAEVSDRSLGVEAIMGGEWPGFGFAPLLLKPGEWFVLEAFADRRATATGRAIAVYGRVRGIDGIRNGNRPKRLEPFGKYIDPGINSDSGD